MTGGWEGSDRRDRLPPDWPLRVKAIRVRSGGRCEHIKASTGRRCTNPANGGVDHALDPDDHRLEALKDLCHWHHSRKTNEEAQRGKQQRKDATKRPVEPPPGLRRTRRQGP